MVKRKDGLSNLNKKERAREVVRKVSRGINLDDMAPIVKDGELLVKKGDEVYFERVKESTPVTCVGRVGDTYEDGQVHVWDETHNEFFLFNWKKLDKTGVRVRMMRSPA